MKGMPRFWKWLIWSLKSERSQVATSLMLGDLKPIVHPRHVPVPTVDHSTRCYLELFRHFTLKGYLPGLSRDNYDLVQGALNGLIITETYTARFPMEYLHGFTASKSSMSNNKTRGSQPTMAAMGMLVDDLRSLEGKSGDAIIEACKSWPELRLKNGISLYTDSWHMRYYWSNSGGSHHMAVLCYELQKQIKSWAPLVEIREHKLELSSLNRLEGIVSIFVVMREEHQLGHDQIFMPLPRDLSCDGVRQSLGVSIPISIYYQQPFSDYHFVIIDHSRRYADIATLILEGAVSKGLAMNFHDFLEAWIAEPLNDLAKPLRVPVNQLESTPL